MILVVGLGNPGKKYEHTRHNVGFLTLDALHTSLSISAISPWTLSKKFNALIAECMIGQEKVILAKPMTFMNSSGDAVALIMHYHSLGSQELIVVHDDKDLAFGEIKVQRDRGHAGHNGVRSIIEHIGTQNFLRFRQGVMTDKIKHMDTATFVLSRFSLLERKKLHTMIQQTVDMILHTLTP